MQLDLFQPQKPKGELHAFPLARRRDLITASAHALISRTNKAGARWWKKHTSELGETYKGYGMGKEAISAILVDYAREVSREMTVLRYRQAG